MSASEGGDYEQADQADHVNIQLLYSCLRHGKIGKIDFQTVATELGLISKNAAYYRWRRLLKSKGIDPNCSRKDPSETEASSHDEDDYAVSEPVIRECKKRKRDEEETELSGYVEAEEEEVSEEAKQDARDKDYEDDGQVEDDDLSEEGDEDSS